MTNFDDYLRALGAGVAELSPAQARAAMAEGALLLDIRERDEIAQGTPAGALHLARSVLEPGIGRHAPDPATPVMLLCASGTRSVLGAAALRQMGYRNVSSVRGGFGAWREQGLPVEVPAMLSGAERQRYARHLAVPEVGEQGQLKLKRARVLLVGCGGLGSPVAMYLAAAGVGSLTLLDFDTVDETNLQRQVLFRETDIGKPKAEAARENLLRLNSHIAVRAVTAKISAENADQLIAQHDIVVDATDNFAARYVIGDACSAHGKPLVHGSIYRFDGQVSVFRAGGACYRCLYREAPPGELAPSCAEAGVLGVLPGVVGALQAVECLKLILGIGDPLVGTLLTYDALDARFTALDYAADPRCAHGAARPLA